MVVEPGTVFLEQFQSVVAKESSSGDWSVPGAANFEWHNETSEEYMAKKSGQSTEGSPQQFDFISAVHSLYYVDDLRVALQFLYDSLAPGSHSRKAFTSRQNMYGHRDEDYYNSSDAKQILNELDIPYTTSEQRIVFNVTSIFDQGSAEGNLLLDFLTHFGHFRETASKETQDAVLTKYRERAREYKDAKADVVPSFLSCGRCDNREL
ncbi:histamine N-methyltransferase-like [Diadema setosum]|uniref:histamine N-methyltransferase-like n=1 Tax=Diadema setosum TaxID=31175 RepID=UPI003B3A8B97